MRDNRAAPDLTYACRDGIWTRFMPETPAGETAWRQMSAGMPDGVVAFLPGQVSDVIAQLRAAGYVVRKARPARDDMSDDALLAELMAP